MRRWRSVVSGAVLAGVVVFGAISGGAVTRGPRVIVRPSTGLRNHEVVRVSGSGFKPHDAVFLVECLATARGQGQCDIATATPATITAKGILRVTRFRVHTGKVGSGACGTSVKNARACAISVGNASGKDTGSARIAFVVRRS